MIALPKNILAHVLTKAEVYRWDCSVKDCDSYPAFVFVTTLANAIGTSSIKKQAYCATHAKAVAKKLKLELPNV